MGQVSFMMPRLACVEVHGHGVLQVHGSHLQLATLDPDWHPPKAARAAMMNVEAMIRMM